MDWLFGGIVATEEGIMTPNMDPPSNHTQEERQEAYIPSPPNNESIHDLTFTVEDCTACRSAYKLNNLKTL